MQSQPTTESVRFAPESENDEKPSHFVRTNTPHPKELQKKKEMLKQRNSSSQEHSVKQNSESKDNHSDIVCEQASNAPQQQLPVINSKLLNDDSSSTTANDLAQSNLTASHQTNEAILKSVNSHHTKTKDLISQPNSINTEPPEETKETNHEPETQASPNDDENQVNNRKHVDFKLSFGTGVVIINDNEAESSPSLPSSPLKLDDIDAASHNENNLASNENDTSLVSNSSNSSGQFRLRRRDTPHHLKGARLNSPNNKAQQLDPNEMKEILERYTQNNNITNGNLNNSLTNGSLANGNASSDSKSLIIAKPKVILLILV